MLAGAGSPQSNLVWPEASGPAVDEEMTFATEKTFGQEIIPN